MAAKRPPNITIILPSGVTVNFWDETGVDGLPQQRRYAYEGEKLVAISTVSNVYDKPALPSWAAGISVEGMIALAKSGVDVSRLSKEGAKQMLRSRALDHDSVRDLAAERGDLAHGVLLRLFRDGELPNLANCADEWRPYVRAGMQFVLDEEPEVIDVETIVCSTEHGFAGRYDLFARFPHRDGRTGRIDFKTVTEWKYSKPRKDGSRDLLPPYPEHLSQVEGYEIGAVESGMEPSDFRGVVRLGPNGAYNFTESWALPEHFLGDLASYRNRQALNAAKPKKAKREAVAA